LPLVMDENGKVLAVLSTNAYYDAAAARESFSPDRQRRVIVARDLNDVLQIWILDLKTNAMTQLTQVTRGIAYDPVWSPDGTRIAYVSTQTGITEIYVYDLTTQTAKQITHTAGPDFFNQRPSWSPDSQKLVFKSNRDDVTRFQIYQMLADGSQLRNLSLNQYNEIDPIWVKP
jgi:TolB protein